ncbi:MBL fold metallo-hydrolase [Nocardioides sp. TRM66260-LWL]|uniref:MBL fold metallo-hydrolase n=1 Tax=Nocardioides sp. TRM66260-LWL TaxID=2874478 RepID=UPI001CC70F1C|nr:MBL fold metallo-hydrolase [Nocardioides sp. TRM66260-LWL]MBZ5736141.1 MBL fold metallo-hydrolase [Nocardioides sp. TRM66260-LWL]
MRIVEVAGGVHLVTGTNVNWVVLAEGSAVTLVDAGYPNDARALLASLDALGHRLEDVEAVVLTHAHLDHVGGVPALRRRRPLPVLTSHEEARHARREYLEQMSVPRMLAQGGTPQGRRWIAQTLRAVLPHASARLREVTGVPFGEPLHLPGAPVPVDLAGHTPGHTGWLLPQRGVLVSGDALVTDHPLSARAPGPQLLPSAFSSDEPTMAARLQALRDLPVDVVVPGHGPVHRGPLAAAIDAALG